MNLKDTFEQVLRKATRSRPFSFPVVTLQAACEVPIGGRAFKVTQLGEDKYQLDFEQTGGPTLNWHSVWTIAGMISGIAFAKTMYGGVADNHFFKILYDVQERMFEGRHHALPPSSSAQS
jgi:hypothetical protein